MSKETKYKFWLTAIDPNTNQEVHLEWVGLSRIVAKVMYKATEHNYSVATGVGAVTRFGWEQQT